MEIDNNSDHRALLAIALNIQHNPYISTYSSHIHIFFTYSHILYKFTYIMDIQISDILHHRNNKQDRDGDRINWKIEINKFTN